MTYSLEQSRRPSLRMTLLRWHGWLGLQIFILLFASFFTGTLIVFVDEIDALLSPPMQPRAEGPPSENFGAAFDALRAERPDDQPLYFLRHDIPTIADHFRVRRTTGGEGSHWTDPATGEYLGRAEITNFRKIVRSFHTSYLTDKRPGRFLTTVMALPLLFFMVSGLIVYRRFWRGFFRLPPRDKGARAFWGGLHRLAALWSVPFMIVMIATVLYYFAGNLGYMKINNTLQIPEVPARETLLPADFDGAALDRATAVARAAMPDLDIGRINFPRSPTAPLFFYGKADAILVEVRGNGVAVDPVTMEVVGQYRASDMSASMRLGHAVEQLHYGHWGGLGGRILWLVFGLTISTLALAGAMIYASRVAPPATGAPRGSAARRIWAGMSLCKWAIILLALGVLAVGVLRFGL